MIEEVINSILEAEDEAKRRVEEAKVAAAETVAHAESQADTIRRNAQADNKTYQQQRLAEADEEIAQEAQRLQQQRNAQTDEEIEKLRQNVDGAVKLILESL